MKQAITKDWIVCFCTYLVGASYKVIHLKSILCLFVVNPLPSVLVPRKKGSGFHFVSSGMLYKWNHAVSTLFVHGFFQLARGLFYIHITVQKFCSCLVWLLFAYESPAPFLKGSLSLLNDPDTIIRHPLTTYVWPIYWLSILLEWSVSAYAISTLPDYHHLFHFYNTHTHCWEFDLDCAKSKDRFGEKLPS